MVYPGFLSITIAWKIRVLLRFTVYRLFGHGKNW
jgi:hypothetical protein